MPSSKKVSQHLTMHLQSSNTADQAPRGGMCHSALFRGCVSFCDFSQGSMYACIAYNFVTFSLALPRSLYWSTPNYSAPINLLRPWPTTMVGFSSVLKSFGIAVRIYTIRDESENSFNALNKAKKRLCEVKVDLQTIKIVKEAIVHALFTNKKTTRTVQT